MKLDGQRFEFTSFLIGTVTVFSKATGSEPSVLLSLALSLGTAPII